MALSISSDRASSCLSHSAPQQHPTREQAHRPGAVDIQQRRGMPLSLTDSGPHDTSRLQASCPALSMPRHRASCCPSKQPPAARSSADTRAKTWLCQYPATGQAAASRPDRWDQPPSSKTKDRSANSVGSSQHTRQSLNSPSQGVPKTTCKGFSKARHKEPGIVE